MIEVVVFKQ